MSTIKQLFNEVKSILQNDAVLSDYVGKIYERERDFISEKYRVVVMLEPTDVIESYFDYPVEATFVLKISGYIFESNPDKSINDGSVKQILDLEKDLKDALRPYYTLNGKCLRFKFSSTRFDRKKDSWGKQEKLRKPPLYGLEIIMNILFQPSSTSAGYGEDCFGQQPYGY